ncbi:hypothetical protein MKEN_01409500 [Mycena kentingensis (nom. inval.)]|nr:hypothetical protein MKEN_01409500 [Mycena kentingensis (nom. inval.)]
MQRQPSTRSRSREREAEYRPRERSTSRHRDTRRRSRSRSRSPKRRRLSASRSRSRDRDRSSRRRSRSKDKRHRGHSCSRSRSGDRRRRRSRSRSASSSSSIDSDRRKRRKRKEKRSKSEERERRERKERKRAKKEMKRDKKKAKNATQWGKYGIITEADMFTKTEEFQTWLVEERKVNPETISKDQNRKEFARFMEDYNTATLPDEKYYNMQSYNRRMDALRGGDLVPPAEDTYDPRADMKAHSSAHRKKRGDEDLDLSREHLMELRKVQNERIQAGKMRQLGMEVSHTMGVRMELRVDTTNSFDDD